MDFQIGQWIKLKGDLGDHYKGVSVVVPRGTPGKVIAFEERNGAPITRPVILDITSTHASSYIVVEMFQSRGQPVLLTSFESAHNIWEEFGSGEPAPPRTIWDRLLDA